MALQEFLASFAVEIDEAGVRRLRTVLEENRRDARTLSGAFAAAASSVKGMLASVSSSFALSRFASAQRESAAAASGAAAAVGSLASAYRELFSLSGRAPAVSAGSPLPVTVPMPERASLDVDADVSGAEGTVSSFVARITALRPRISANAAGITAAVSAAIASVRSMLSGLTVTIPVRTLPEAPELPSLPFASMPALPAAAGSCRSVQAPVNIHVNASGTSAEAVGRSVYDTAERYLLKTVKGVFEK